MPRIFAYLYQDPLLEPYQKAIVWGIKIDYLYHDWGQRQQLGRLMLDVENNPPDALILRSVQELGSSVVEVSNRLNKIESLGIEVIAIETDYRSSEVNQLDPITLKENTAQLFGQIQDNLRQNRLRQGHARNRLAAVPPPGKAPYGYRRGKDRYILDRSTAPIVKDFFEQFLLFGSLRGAVRHLEKRYGKKISPSTGRRWLTHPVYRGDLGYLKQDVIPNTHIGIISREEAAQIDRLLRRNRIIAPKAASAPRSLAGLVVCHCCQSLMSVTRVTSRSRGKEYLYLRAISCQQPKPCRAIAYQPVLEATIHRICQDLPAAVAKLSRPNPQQIKQSLQQAIQQQRHLMDRLAQLQEEGVLDEETLLIRRYKLNTEIAEIRSRIEQLPPENLAKVAEAVSLPQFWLDLSEPERRFYFREFIRQIQLIRDDSGRWEVQIDFIF